MLRMSEPSMRIERKPVRTLRLRVRSDGSVAVTVPQFMAQADVDAFLEKKWAWIEKQQARMASSRVAQLGNASAEEQVAWRVRVEERIPDLVKRWAARMGVDEPQVTYRAMTSRWGSCRPKTKRITINARLGAFPDECLEYVIVHELCHLKEAGHGQAFYDLLNEYYPSWPEAQRQLKL